MGYLDHCCVTSTTQPKCTEWGPVSVCSIAIRVRDWGEDVWAMVATEGLDPTLRYEDSRLDVCVYELHVWLLAADRHTVIAQHHVAPRTSRRGSPGCWIQVTLPSPATTPRLVFTSQDLTEGKGRRAGLLVL